MEQGGCFSMGVFHKDKSSVLLVVRSVHLYMRNLGPIARVIRYG